MNEELRVIGERMAIAVAGFCEALEGAANEFRRTSKLMNELNANLQTSVDELSDGRQIPATMKTRGDDS